MKASLRLDRALHFIGTNDRGQQTEFDTSESSGGLDSAASPVEITLEAMAACSSMDIIAIIKKKRRSITAFTVNLEAERSDEHPKVLTKVHMDFQLESPDATLKELGSAIDLSLEKYCSVTIMIKRSGCIVTWSATLKSGATSEKLSSEEFRPEKAAISP